MKASVAADVANSECPSEGFLSRTGVPAGKEVDNDASELCSEQHDACRLYDEAAERGRALFCGLPTLDSAVRFKRVWSIPEALEQYGALTRQKELIAEIGKSRTKVRQTQRAFALLKAQETLQLVREQGKAGGSSLTQEARRAAEELSKQDRLLALEEAIVSGKTTHIATEVESARQAMVELKLATDDPEVLATVAGSLPPPPRTKEPEIFYCANCKVGGHGQRFSEYLLKRPNWRIYPYESWFKDAKSTREYLCPLGKHVVDFTDETKFSRVAMYIKGNMWMEDKTKLFEIVPEHMPDTYVIEDRKWRNGRAPPADHTVGNLPWFVKGSDRNYGTSVHMCRKPSECMPLAKAGATYAVQQHIHDPLCMDDGRKCHIKFYILLMCHADGRTWELWTWRNGYLSISPVKWSPTDLSKECQVTIVRTERINTWKHWDAAYPKCKAGIADVVRKLVQTGKLEGTPGRAQFEIMSADYIVDMRGNVWLFEFNTSCVLKDPQDSPDVNDGALITAALSIVFPWEGGSPGEWDHALRCQGKAYSGATSADECLGAAADEA